MTSPTILTIDIGTSGTKTALWSAEGRQLAEASQEYPLHRPDPIQAEIDAEVWWQAACSTTRAVLMRSGASPSSVAGIGIDGVSWTLVPVDEACRSLHPAMIWLDRRAEEESRWLQALPEAPDLVQLCANPLDPAYITPKLIWLRRHRPEIFAAAHQFLTSTGYITARMTGEFTCDYTQAYAFHFFDMLHARWDERAAALLGIPLGKLPRLCPPSEIVGRLLSTAATEMGLPAGVPVIAGGLDAAFGALGSGVTRLGKTNEQGGQAGGMGVSVDHVVVEPQLIFSHHVLPKQYLLQAGTVGGGSLNWFRSVLGKSSGVSFEQLSREAAETAPGAHGLIFLPYMAGERTPLWNTRARGVFFGLSYAARRGDLARSVMEGCAFAVYHNLKIAEAKGVQVSEWYGSGGATHSPVWCQIKADISGRPFIVARMQDGREGGHLLGLYAVTAQAAGLCGDAAGQVESLLPQRQEFTPVPERRSLYEDLFGIYLELSQKMLGEFDHLDEVVQRNRQILYQEVSS